VVVMVVRRDLASLPLRASDRRRSLFRCSSCSHRWWWSFSLAAFLLCLLFVGFWCTAIEFCFGSDAEVLL
jgi:hypothetical protein